MRQIKRTNPTKLSVLTVNYRTSDFIESMLYCLRIITHYPYKVLIADNFSSSEEKLRIKKICQKYDNTEIFLRTQSQTGSIGHGEALDLLTKKVDTPYFAILDSDATFLMRKWDEKLISELNFHCKVIGTQAKLNQIKKPLDFPLMFAILFETQTFKDLNVQFKPPSKKDIVKGLDTGYQLREKYRSAKKNGKLLYHNYSINRKTSPFYKIACAEYFLPGYDGIIASHFWRGATLSISENISLNNRLYDLIKKVPIIGRRLISYKRKTQKKKWIRICKKIAVEQIA